MENKTMKENQNNFFGSGAPKIYNRSSTKRKNAILGLSICWFIYAITIAFITAIIVITFANAFFKSIQNNLPAIITLVIAFIVFLICMIVEHIHGPRLNFWVQFTLITISMIGLGFFLLSGALIILLDTYNKDFNNFAAISKTILVVLAPLLFMALMGLLAYYDKIKINLLYSFLMVVGIGMIFIFILSFFVWNSWLNAVFPVLGFALVCGYMAFDLWLITRYNKAYARTQSNSPLLSKEVNRLVIYFGFSLAYNYIIALYYLARIIANFRK
ncbi:MAG0110 family membrane protein [Mycoplasma tauri]|uniref:MAG0110 family membrane protein n=1 Tax=Mycoplasma tauri TaxID=547987 RepID=UPI001CC11939|nr:hypothetical protein [Mycoplasma tauri]MBZ4226978.1 hypothetical protein [Mycoplasma tauri]